MISIHVIAVGRLREEWLHRGCAEYLKRLRAWCSVNISEVEEYRLPDHPSAAQIETGLRREGRQILEKVPKGAAAIAMCIEGKSFSSQRLAQYFEKSAVEGVGTFVFIIGGSHGLCPAVKEAAALRLSMSKMTFPHQLARLMLFEQIYRALSIHAGAKYHK